jgi:hypothetical protein
VKLKYYREGKYKEAVVTFEGAREFALCGSGAECMQQFRSQDTAPHHQILCEMSREQQLQGLVVEQTSFYSKPTPLC